MAVLTCQRITGKQDAKALANLMCKVIKRFGLKDKLQKVVTSLEFDLLQHSPHLGFSQLIFRPGNLLFFLGLLIFYPWIALAHFADLQVISLINRSQKNKWFPLGKEG